MKLKISQTGILGEAALREAFSGDLRQLGDLLQGAIKKALELTGEEDWWPYIRGLFPDFIVVEAKDGKLLKYTYSIDGTDVVLSNPVEVVQSFADAKSDMREAQVVLLEADDKTPGTFLIRVIKAGLSGNRNFYSDSVLREALSLFEGVRVLVKSDEEHLAGKGKDVRNIIGQLSDPQFIEGAALDTGEIRATLTMIEPEGDVTVKLREACNRGLTGLFGFSIDANGSAKRGRIAGHAARIAKKITKVKSVDLIVEPGAGGEVIELIEAHSGDNTMREMLIKLIEAKRPDLLKGKKVDDLSDDELEGIFKEAIEPVEDADDPADEDPATQTTSQEIDIHEAVRMVEARAYARTEISGSQLPDSAKKKLKALFMANENFREADVDTAITDEQDYLSEFAGDGHVSGLGGASRVELIEARSEKVTNMLDAFFDPANQEVQSFKECYVLMTGDDKVTGRLQDCDQSLMREALDSGSFTQVLGDGMHRRMIADYRVQSNYDVWRRLADVGNVNDFRTQERTRWGGYGDLPIVAEKGSYDALTSPTDESANFAVKKRGGTETITLEMIKNDDAGVIRRLPAGLSRSAKRTLSKFVLDFVKNNPVIYDGATLFHASHGNLGTAALDKASLSAARLAMLGQTEKDNNEPMSIGPQNLWVPQEQEEIAVDLFRRNTENDKNFVQSLSLEIIPVWYWTDTNDWAVTADFNDIPTIEVGFLDGQQEPQIFIQDNPLVGSMFTNDQVTYKIRHIYGGTALDYRGMYKGVVA